MEGYNMSISIEKIDMVVERTNVSYTKAKEMLLKLLCILNLKINPLLKT